ncbi:MAG: hypothetical protein GTN36_01580 [Candidatus Aenigmarchaeota archaeon]|nr:hypothetical protein [Candidatus Aenigmarchaeota archaeon]
MSVLKSILGFIVSSLFIISLYLTITSYTVGDLIQRDNVKSFIQAQTMGELASETCEELCTDELESQNCDDYCSYLDFELRDMCIEECQKNISQDTAKQSCIDMCLSKSNESQEYIYNTVDEIYSNKIVDDITLNDITIIFKNTILFMVLSLIFGFSILLVSDKPITKIGNNIVVVGISLASMAVIPVFIITPDIPMIEIITSYVAEGFYQQLYIGITLIIIGIVLIVIGKKVKLKRGEETEKVEKKEKKIKKSK